MEEEKRKPNLRAIVREDLREAGLWPPSAPAPAEDECRTPAEECRSKKGAAGCRIHCAKYFDYLRDGVAFEEAVAGLREKYGIECVKRKYARKVITDRNILAYLDGQTKPISEEDYQASVRALWVVLNDLTSRFPKFRIMPLVYVGAESNDPDERGCGSADTIDTNVCFLMFNVRLSIQAFKGQSYGHKDGRLPYDIIRHEIGHSITLPIVLLQWRKAMLNQAKQTGGVPRLREELQLTVSSYAAYSPQWEYDSLAEAFAKYTSYDYKSDMPAWIDEFFTRLLHGGLQ